MERSIPVNVQTVSQWATGWQTATILRKPYSVKSFFAIAIGGFTCLAEALIAFVMMSLVASLGLPRLTRALHNSDVRSARVVMTNLAVTARMAAVQRGCIATLKVTTGPSGTAWVTACKVDRAGTDTLGKVEQLGSRFGVEVTASASLLRFSPAGTSIGFQPLIVTFVSLKNGASMRDSVVINSLGTPVRF
jgi:Tfp pilus assembly protein FimT